MLKTIANSILFLSICTVGCGGKKKTPVADTPGVESAVLLPGKAPTLPPPFAKLSEGMPIAEAKALAPGFWPEGDKPRSLELPGFPDARFDLYLDDTGQKVERMALSLPKDRGKDLVTAAWGAPMEGKDSIGRAQAYWWNPETGRRAILEEGFGENVLVNFSRYIELSALLGDGPEVAFARDRKLLGATVAELRAAFGAQLVEESVAEATESRKKIEALAGERLDELGAPKPHAYLELLPTRWGKYWTRVDLDFDDAGKLRGFRFGLAYEPNESARAEILGVLHKKWGAGKEGEDLGRKVWTFADNPRITLMDDDISRQWDLSVELPEAP